MYNCTYYLSNNRLAYTLCREPCCLNKIPKSIADACCSDFNNDDDDGRGLTIAIVAIVFGTLCFLGTVAGIITGIVCCVRQSSQRRRPTANYPAVHYLNNQDPVISRFPVYQYPPVPQINAGFTQTEFQNDYIIAPPNSPPPPPLYMEPKTTATSNDDFHLLPEYNTVAAQNNIKQ